MSSETIAATDATAVLELLPPFPVVLVSTRTNVLTIGQVEYFTFRPLRLGIAVGHPRHSYALLKAEGEFVVNVPSASLLEAVKLCGKLSGRDGDKFAAAGLTAEPSLRVRAVSVAECTAHIECRVVREVPFERRTWFIGEVVAARRAAGHAAGQCLLCDRHHYRLSGPPTAPR